MDVPTGHLQCPASKQPIWLLSLAYIWRVRLLHSPWLHASSVRGCSWIWCPVAAVHFSLMTRDCRECGITKCLLRPFLVGVENSCLASASASGWSGLVRSVDLVLLTRWACTRTISWTCNQ
ncbi:hypothetical protein DOTSEDRAFT_67427 [Dothistroma septosporum NZE10]|uniref:Uncharacterized protein n=1 Tax=Dothistroma septosporum (strain NZE10 / CBS 128990) TaxID=675120 RepID=N1PZB6_DOTSN|nr:hypothetical protein DOTSEDRAFT_67427 [Dothistroma septosporum NZE10]